jgi:SpoIID/LytB domain protein
MRSLLAVTALALLLCGTASGASVFLVEGRGNGHGVGLGQWGAEGYARHGWDYRRILAHYYPDTRLDVARGREVRVLLERGLARAQISARSPFLVLGPGGRAKHVKRSLGLTPTSRLPVTVVPGAAPLALDGGGYRGELVVLRREGKLTVVNRLPLERYLRGVVPWEVPKGWHAAAYEAQTVAARSYALARLRPKGDFDVLPDTSDQVYGGIRAERRETNLAVGATAGRVLTWNGQIVEAFYSSSSGGRTASSADVFGRPLPYLVPVSDPYDAISPYHRWRPLAFTIDALAAHLQAPRLRDIVVERDASGRAATVRLVGADSTRSMPGRDFARALGLRSTAFSIRVLSLRTPVRWAVHGRPFPLAGFVRGLDRVRLQERSRSGAWRTVARVRPHSDGRFVATVRPRRTTCYRLAVPAAAGAEVRVIVASGGKVLS